MIRVDVEEGLSHVYPLPVRLRILLAQVPRDSQVVPEPGDQLAVVELPDPADVAGIEMLVVLSLLGLKVDHQSGRRRVLEHHFPLVQLRAVVPSPVVLGPRP